MYEPQTRSINIIKIFIPVKLTLLFSYICNLLSYCQLINKKGNSFTNKQNTFLEYHHEYVVFPSEIFKAYRINIDIFARKYIHVCTCCSTCTLRIIFFKISFSMKTPCRLAELRYHVLFLCNMIV